MNNNEKNEPDIKSCPNKNYPGKNCTGKKKIVLICHLSSPMNYCLQEENLSRTKNLKLVP